MQIKIRTPPHLCRGIYKFKSYPIFRIAGETAAYPDLNVLYSIIKEYAIKAQIPLFSDFFPPPHTDADSPYSVDDSFDLLLVLGQ